MPLATLPIIPTIPIVSPPHIDAISPDIITTNPYKITISGSGFTPTGNTVLIPSERRDGFTELSSVDGKTINVTTPISFVEKLKNDPFFTDSANIDLFVDNMNGSTVSTINGIKCIEITVSVENIKGTSNEVSVCVDLKSIMKN